MLTKVNLRQKPISGNRQSLYLDFYPPIKHPETGAISRREFLSLYTLSSPKTQIVRAANKEILRQAEQIRQKWYRDLNGNETLNALEKRMLSQELLDQQKGQQDFISYFKSLLEKRTGSNQENWDATHKHLIAFGELKFSQVTVKTCNAFKEFLLSKVSQNSAQSYFNKFKAALRQAHLDGYLPEIHLENIKETESHRNFLSIEDLNLLVKAPCRIPNLKRAALFSALTGLRFSDIEKLTWDEVVGNSLRFASKKPKAPKHSLSLIRLLNF